MHMCSAAFCAPILSRTGVGVLCNWCFACARLVLCVVLSRVCLVLCACCVAVTCRMHIQRKRRMAERERERERLKQNSDVLLGVLCANCCCCCCSHCAPHRCHAQQTHPSLNTTDADSSTLPHHIQFSNLPASPASSCCLKNEAYTQRLGVFYYIWVFSCMVRMLETKCFFIQNTHMPRSV